MGARTGRDDSLRESRMRDQDRRSGMDRRGASTLLPRAHEARPYGFRDFSERRRKQDRRLYGGIAEAELHSLSHLTREDVATLLSKIRF